MADDDSRNARRDRAIADIGARQKGRIRTNQLKALDVGDATIEVADATIERWCDRGRLHRVRRGVYALGHRDHSRELQFREALLDAGDDAALSFWSCGEDWGLPVEFRRVVHVTVPVQQRNVPGVIRHTSHLARDEVIVRNGMRTTTVARMFLDLAGAGTRRRRLEILMEHADRKNLRWKSDLTRLVERYRGRRGTRVLRDILDSGVIGTTLTLSDKEELLIGVLDAAGIPRGVFNHVIRLDDGSERRPDCWFIEEQVAVQIESRTYHGSWFARREDMARDGDLAALGILTLPVAWEDLVEQPERFVARLRATLEQRRR